MKTDMIKTASSVSSGILLNPVGLFTLAKREILRFLVVAHQTLFPPLVSASLFLCIFGLSVGKQLRFGDVTYIHYIIPGIITMYLISSSYENTSSSLFISRWQNHIQEILLSPLSYFEMVLGLLAGGVARGMIVAAGVYGISYAVNQTSVANPWLTLYFMLTISVIFSCGGMMAALWAKDFGMLSIWNVYVITPLVFLGGVFNPIELLPQKLQLFARINPMYYLVSGMRAGLVGIVEVPIAISVWLSLVWSLFMFFLAVHLFKIGYKLRT